jgi:putative transposase
MSRPARIIHPDQPLHIMQRGNNRCPIFSSLAEYRVYLELLKHAADESGCQIHAFVLMTNHVHLLVTPTVASGPPLLMKAVSEKYARFFNSRHERTGTLWEGRYRSTLIDSPNYFFCCSRYIELNPQRAGMVEHPADYRWSSYAQNAGAARKTLVTAHPLYEQLDASEPERRAAYRGLCDTALTDETLDAIRGLISRRPNARGTRLSQSRQAAMAQLLRAVPRSNHLAAEWRSR